MLNWVDLVIIAIIALSVFTGLIRGFVKELISLVVWVLSIWIAFNYSQVLHPWLQNYIQDKTIRNVTAFIIILLAALIVGGIANTIISFILKRTGLSSADRFLGMGFGFVRGVFIVALIMAVIKMADLPYQEYANSSVLYAKFDPIVDWLCSLAPDFIKQVKLFEFNKLSEAPIPSEAGNLLQSAQ
jgi:membrane protein required for colicin V production